MHIFGGKSFEEMYIFDEKSFEEMHDFGENNIEELQCGWYDDKGNVNLSEKITWKININTK